MACAKHTTAATSGEPSEDPSAFLLSQGKEASHDSVEAFLVQPERTDAPPAERRLSPDLVDFVLSLKREVPSIDHLDELASIFPPEWIEKRRQEHEERVALYSKIDDGMELYQAQLRKEFQENGYVKTNKIDADWVARLTRLEAWGKEQFAKSRMIEFNDSDFED